MSTFNDRSVSLERSNELEMEEKAIKHSKPIFIDYFISALIDDNPSVALLFPI